MNRLALVGFLRSLTRHRLYAALNIGGLAVGIAVFIILGLYVRFETGFEHWIPDWRHIYLVEAQAGSSTDARLSSNTPEALWTDASRDLPGLQGTRVDTAQATVVQNGIGVREILAGVDPDFPKLFDLPVASGSLAGAFDDPSNIVVTQKIADAFLGAGNPIGKTLTVSFNGEAHSYRVAAVIRNLPAGTELEFDMLTRLVLTQDAASPFYRAAHQWNYYDTATYVRAADPAAAARLKDEIVGVAARHAKSETPDEPTVTIKLSLLNIADVHFKAPGAKLSVATLGLVGVLTLLIAAVNYVNLATARAGLRAREVAMRKVLGADRGTLARHYVGEAIATAAIAAVIGLALAEAGMPLVNAASGLSLSIRYFGADGVLLPLVGLVVVIGLLAGIYPALLLSRFPAAAVLASARSPGGGRSGTVVREGLVLFQFAIAIAFTIGTLVLVAQTRHVRAADLGYDRQGLLVVPSLASNSLNEAQRESIVHRIAAVPGIEAVAVANNVPGPSGVTMETQVAVPGVPGQGVPMRFFETGPGFFDVMHARLLAGRLFDPARAADVNPNFAHPDANGNLPNNVVINRAALAPLHIASPAEAVGTTVGGGPNQPRRTIIGVVEDMRFDSPREPIAPTIFDFQLHDMDSQIAVARFSGDPKAVIARVRAAWIGIAPEVPFSGRTVVQNLDQFYASDDHAARLFIIGAVLAVAIGCVGLWGLASFNTARRVKEIGIRKTLGASTADIVRLLVGQMLRPVLIANLLAWPLAYAAMRTWLAGFSDRIALSPLFFIAATVLALLIAVTTVLAQSLRAARATPSWALRHE